MPEQIDELFVKLGLEQDKREFDQAEASFDSLRSTALQFGAAIGAGIGLQDLTFGFAETTNELNKMAQEFEGLEVTPQLVSQLQGAFRLIDEDASEAGATIRNLAGILEDTDWGQIPEDAIARGFDVSAIADADTMTEALAALNEQMRGIGDQEQARRMASALGLSSAQFRLMRETDVGGQMQRASELNPLTQEMSEAAAQFQEGMNELSLSFDGLKNVLSEQFVGDMGEGMSELADIMAENRDAIRQFVEEAIPYLKGAATGIGTLVALRMGRAALGAFANVPGAVALAAGIGVGVSSMRDSERIDEFTDENRERARSEEEKEIRRNIEMLRDMGPRGDQEGYDEQMERLQNQLDRAQGDDLSMGGAGGGPAISYEFNVDARGSTDPQATEQAVQRGAEKALARAAENTVNDFRSPIT